MKPFKSVEFFSIFRVSSPTTELQSPPIKNFLATVLVGLSHIFHSNHTWMDRRYCTTVYCIM